MKITFAVYTICALLLSLSTAQAAAVDELGLISSTQSGVLLQNNSIGSWSNDNKTIFVDNIDEQYSGTLAAHTSITFSFSITPNSYAANAETLTGTGGYNGNEINAAGQSLYYNGSTSANLTGSSASVSPYNSSGGINLSVAPYSISEALLIATANIVDSKNSYVTITNNSPIQSSFLARLQVEVASLSSTETGLITTYSSVSSVPLPGSLMLFGLGLGALAGVSIWRKKARGSFSL